MPFISFLIDPLPYLLFLEQGLITRYDSDNRGELVTVSASQSFVAFDVDIYTGDIFGISSEDSKVRNQKYHILFTIMILDLFAKACF